MASSSASANRERRTVNIELANYRVLRSASPDKSPIVQDQEAVDHSIKDRVKEQYLPNSIFTGGFKCTTRAHILDKVTDAKPRHIQMAGSDGSCCSFVGCDGKDMTDNRGKDMLPCECNFKICIECFREAITSDEGICPGCKEPYKTVVDELFGNTARPLPFPPPSDRALNMERRNSMKRSGGSLTHRLSKRGEFDHSKWLYKTNGTYGYGNAIWPSEGVDPEQKVEGGSCNFKVLLNKPWRPLTRKLKISAAVLRAHRLLIVVRIIVLALFLTWRVRHKNEDAVWLWGMSVVCEIWFAFSWLLGQLPKLCPVDRTTDLAALKERFETSYTENPISDLPGLDVFVSTADPEKEPPLLTANTILSILAADYPPDKLSCYVSDDGGALLTFEAMAEAANFAKLWVPFCRKYDIEPRNPEAYFSLKRNPYKKKVRSDFVKERRHVKREYDEFKVRINALPHTIQRRSDCYNCQPENRATRHQLEIVGNEFPEQVKIPQATWMADGNHWPGTWIVPSAEHSRGDHVGIIQVMLEPPGCTLLHKDISEECLLDLTETDFQLPMLVYVSREKRPGYDDNNKAGAMNALVRASAIMSNGPFILNLDCDHYVYNSQAFREGMCFMMDRGGDWICYVQYPHHVEGVEPSYCYANHNVVFFDGNMRALDGLQGPINIGTGCLFCRHALYGFDPPRSRKHSRFCSCCFPQICKKHAALSSEESEALILEFKRPNLNYTKKFGNSSLLIDSILTTETHSWPFFDNPSVKNGQNTGPLMLSSDCFGAPRVAEAINVISCWYEDKTDWGISVGWIYGYVTEEVVTGYKMHNRGWRSVYCITKRDAFRGTAPINLTDRLHQVLRWSTGSVEVFFSRNNALLASTKMEFLQRIAYLNVAIYPFTSIFLIVYCFLPALSLFSDQFIVQTLDVTFVTYLLAITITLVLLAILEVKWIGIHLEEWWTNEHFWLIDGTSSHFIAVLQGLLKVITGTEILSTLTSKSSGNELKDDFVYFYIVKWASLNIPPLTIIMVNLIALVVGFSRSMYSVVPQWSKLLGGVFFSFWVLAHLYPFAKGLMGRRGKAPAIVFVLAGLFAITISLLWMSINPPSGGSFRVTSGAFQFP